MDDNRISSEYDGNETTAQNLIEIIFNKLNKNDKDKNKLSVIEKKITKFGEETTRVYIKLESEFEEKQLEDLSKKSIVFRNPQNNRYHLLTKRFDKELFKISLYNKRIKTSSKNLPQLSFLKNSKSKFSRDPECSVDFIIQCLDILENFKNQGIYSTLDYNRIFHIEGNGDIGSVLLIIPRFSFLDYLLEDFEKSMYKNDGNQGKIDGVKIKEINRKYENIPYIWPAIIIMNLLDENTLEKLGINLQKQEEDPKIKNLKNSLKEISENFLKEAKALIELSDFRILEIIRDDNIKDKNTEFNNLQSELKKRGTELFTNLRNKLKRLIYHSVYEQAEPRLFSINIMGKNMGENINFLRDYMSSDKSQDFDKFLEKMESLIILQNEELDKLHKLTSFLANKLVTKYEISLEKKISDESITFQIKLKNFPIKYTSDTNPKEFLINVEYLQKKNILCVRTKIPELAIVVENYDDLAFLFQYITTKEKQFSIEVDENRKISIRITSCPGFEMNFFPLLMRSIDRSLLLAFHIYSYYTNIWLSSGNKPSKDYEHYETVYRRIKKDMKKLNKKLDDVLNNGFKIENMVDENEEQADKNKMSIELTSTFEN